VPDYCTLAADTNQALGIAQYAIRFVGRSCDDMEANVWKRLELFHLDSVACGMAALACGTNAPKLLRREALDSAIDVAGAFCFNSDTVVPAELAVAANCSAVRELDSNGTNFGYNPAIGAVCGEFGHNDFYPVVVAAAQRHGHAGATLALGMLCLDEIRGRLAEVFSLKSHAIDHVVHGGIASAAVYGALAGATGEQIEAAIGMLLAHYVPFRAIRAGEQLSDSKGASAALTAECAVRCVQRVMRGFIGPRDIFRNPKGLFRLFEPTDGASPFDLRLAEQGDDFAVMGMHFKLGLYEHQSAGAIQGLIDVLQAEPHLLEAPLGWQQIRIRIYEPAFGIIGDPAKRNPTTRQSADHSMVYIIATKLRKAFESRSGTWADLMLLPDDYSDAALYHPRTRQIMDLIEFEHGGAEFDAAFPEGIPTSLDVVHDQGTATSGMVMFPLGHARHSGESLSSTLRLKFSRLLGLAQLDARAVESQLQNLATKTKDEISRLYNFQVNP